MAEMICRDCGTIDRPKRVTKGSTMIELILWLCFIVPGLIYSFWRLSTRYDACSACGSTALVPVSSPVGRKIASEYTQDVPVEPVRNSNAGAAGRALGSAFRKVVLRK